MANNKNIRRGLKNRLRDRGLMSGEYSLDGRMPSYCSVDKRKLPFRVVHSKRVTDKDLARLAQTPQLQELILDGQITDRGLDVLSQLRELRVFKMYWQGNVTDQGIANLRFCDQLEEVDLLGCNTGDGAIAALAGKPKLRQFKTGRNVSDDGLALLQQFPAFKTRAVEEPE